MGRSRIGWAAGTVAPWCLAVGVLLSITARANEERAPDASVFVRGAFTAADSPLRRAIEAASRYEAVGLDGTPEPLDREPIGDRRPRRSTGDPDEIEPNRALKAGAKSFPDIDRSGKGDPFIGLRPGFEARRRGGPASLGSDAQLIARGRSSIPTTP